VSERANCGLSAGPALARRNPVAKLGAALILMLVLLATLDPLTPALCLAVEVAALPLFGVRPVPLARGAWPLLASAAGLAAGQVLFGIAGPLTALGLAVRLLAVALPGILVFTSTDPTDLADALIQQLRVPARFAIGALAAFRLVPLLGEEWHTLMLARRARGVDAGRNPLAALRLTGSVSFALLVGAIRRGTRLAAAMDARGFDSGAPRTFARQQHFGRADVALLTATALLAGGALAISAAAGVFHPVFG
jgi:energy-coupling factor transport system permease protein